MKVTRYGSLDALPESYRLLFRQAEQASFFDSELWYQVLLAAASEADQELCLYGVEDSRGGKPWALLLTATSPGQRGPLGARLLRGCQSVYTLRFAPLIAADCPDRRGAIAALVGALLEDKPGWDIISFAMLDRDSADFDDLLIAFRGAGLVTEPYFQFGNWYEDIEAASFDKYLAKRGKSVKKTLAWKARRFARRDDAAFEIYSGGAGLERAKAAFMKIYESSWKEPERYPHFIGHLMQACADRGQLRLGNLYLEGEPVATWFIILSHGTAIGFKTAYDPNTPSNLSVGGVLTFEMIKYLVEEDKVSRIDFGIGDEAYKSQWLSCRRERWGILAYNSRTPRGLVLGGLAQGRAVARKILRPAGRQDEQGEGSRVVKNVPHRQ